jgi:hypothetical protein
MISLCKCWSQSPIGKEMKVAVQICRGLTYVQSLGPPDPYTLC